MLKKLLKYDLINAFKLPVIFYILAVVSGIITRLLFLVENSFIVNIFAHIFNGITISMLVNILINSLTRLWVLFIKSIYGDESYLTHTLPCTKDEIYLSKFLTSLVVNFVGVLVVFVVIIITYYTKENFTLLKNSLDPLSKALNSTILEIILAVVILFFLEMMALCQSVFAGVLLGHRKNSKKVLFSVVFSFVSYLAIQILMLLSVFVVGLFNNEIMSMFNSTTITNINILKSLIIIGIVAYTLGITILYFVNIKILKKGVNVD